MPAIYTDESYHELQYTARALSHFIKKDIAPALQNVYGRRLLELSDRLTTQVFNCQLVHSDLEPPTFQFR